MPCRATQDRRVIMQSLDKMWSTGGGNGKPLKYSCHKNHMNPMKRQKDMTLEDEPPSPTKSEVALYAKRNQPWIFIGRTDAEAPVLWPPDAKSQLIGNDPDAGKDRRQKEKRAAEDKMVREHHWINGHEFEQTLGDCEGQGSLVCYSPWGHKETDTT